MTSGIATPTCQELHDKDLECVREGSQIRLVWTQSLQLSERPPRLLRLDRVDRLCITGL